MDDPVFHASSQEPSTSSSTALPDTLPINISTQYFQGIFLWAITHHPWHQLWHCPPCLLSHTINILKVLPFLTPQPSWHTSLKDINRKCSWFLAKGEKNNLWHYGWLCNSMSLVRNNRLPPSNPFITPSSWHTCHKDDQHETFRLSSLETLWSLGIRTTQQPSTGARRRGA